MSNLNFDNFFADFKAPTYEEWKEESIKALKGVPFDKKMFTKTYEGITLNAIYNFNDIKDLPLIENQNPGESPYLRSTKTGSYKTNPWLINQELPYALPDIFNKSALNDLWQGQSAITINLNSSFWTGKIGSNSDLILNSIEDFLIAFKGIKETMIPIYYNVGPAGLAFASILEAFCHKVNVDFSELKGGIDFDPIGYLLVNGSIDGKLQDYFAQMKLLTEWFGKESANQSTIAVNGRYFHNAGANSVQELAYSFAQATDYINELGERGLEIDQIAPKIKFNLSIGTDFFMEIAKFRAARIVWAKIISEYQGNTESQKIFVHAETSKRERTKYDPYVNMLRNTSQTFSAVLGGADSINVRYFDERYGLASNFSRRMSINTHHIINEEAHSYDSIDAAGGSWYIEWLTNEIAERTWDLFKNTVSDSTFVSKIESGKIQNDINELFVSRINNLSTRKDIILGTNKYPLLIEKKVENLIEISDDDLDNHLVKINEFKSKRDNSKLEESLASLDKANINLDALKAAAKADATGYELYTAITDTNNKVEIKNLPQNYSSSIFEELRDRALIYKEKNGEFPKVHLVCFGDLKFYKPRADFSSDFFTVGGFESVIIDGFNSAVDAIKPTLEANPKVVVLCSTDEIYANVVEDYAKELKSQNKDVMIVLAGYPVDKIDDYKNAGVDEFIHIKANIYEINSKLQEYMNIAKNAENQI